MTAVAVPGVGRRALLGLSSFILLQVVSIGWDHEAGIPLYAACSGLAVFWGALGAWVVSRYGGRDPRAGQPFEGTQQNFRKKCNGYGIVSHSAA